MELLLFEIERRRYALPLAAVREVLRAVAITPLPGTPAVIEGVIDVRGEIVPVLDIRSRFHLPGKELEPGEQLIVAMARERLVALRADRVIWMIRVDASAIESAADLRTDAEYVAGVAKLPDGLVLIHDLHSFLTQAESTALEAALVDALPPGERSWRS